MSKQSDCLSGTSLSEIDIYSMILTDHLSKGDEIDCGFSLLWKSLSSRPLLFHGFTDQVKQIILLKSPFELEKKITFPVIQCNFSSITVELKGIVSFYIHSYGM